MSLSIVTWNIQRGLGADLKRDIQRTGCVLAALDADVVALEEVQRSHALDQAAYLAERAGATLVFGEARRSSDGPYGNALLVRGEVLASTTHDLSVVGREARTCLDATVEVRGETLRVFVCHLGLGVAERRKQVHRLAEVLAAARGGPPRVVLGDFNEPFAGDVDALLSRAFPAAPSGRRSHPSPMPLWPLDRIVWDHPLRGSVEVVAERWASDHRPVRARLARAGAARM